MKALGARTFLMHWRSPKVAGFFLFAALGLLGLGATGCTGFSAGYPTMYGYSVVSASTVPVSIYDYPSYYWNGDYAYLVNGSWYYPSSTGWVIFEQEPYDLYRYRNQYYARYPQYYSYPMYGGYPSYPSGGVQVAPPARRPAAPQVEYDYRAPAPVYRAPVQTAPPAYGSYGSQVQTAPPAVVDPSPSRPPVQAAPPAYRERGPAAPRGGVQSAPRAPRRR